MLKKILENGKKVEARLNAQEEENQRVRMILAEHGKVLGGAPKDGVGRKKTGLADFPNLSKMLPQWDHEVDSDDSEEEEDAENSFRQTGAA
eukprot:12382828-Karenia_brevis.AAC.1